MKGSPLTFLLVPDSSAARRVRRLLAEQEAFSGLVVGIWQELTERARLAYLVPDAGNDAELCFRQALEELDDPFWAESLAVAPDETTKAVRSAFIRILSATEPAREYDIPGLDSLPGRPRQHLEDLMRLAALLDDRLPTELSIISSLLSADPGDALHTMRVLHIEGTPSLTNWQASLVTKLNKDAGVPGDSGDKALLAVLGAVLCGESAGRPGASLRLLQDALFNVVEEKGETDGAIQWVGVRDFLQEAEVAAGMVQSLLGENPGLQPADIGLLIPDSFEYATALKDAFPLGGMALSGLPAEAWRRDLGREALFHFLYCRQKPAPAMALAALLSSPLMPWSRDEGAVLSQSVMDGDYRLRPLPTLDRDGKAMLDLLREGDTEPASLARALPVFLSLLRGPEELAGHIQQARAALEQLIVSLEQLPAIEWAQLRRIVSPGFLTSGEAPDFNREGVTVWRESQAPWRPVKHLIVLGFAQGHYPSAQANDPVFSSDDLASLRQQTGLPVTTAMELLEERRLRFKRQLGSVSKSVTFLVPRRDPLGERQTPSDSLVFMHQLFEGPDSAEERIAELDAADDRALIRHLALVAPAAPQPARSLLAEDLRFDRDLLALRSDGEGRLKPESPSSLETLMVSRFAWLLRRLDAEPLLWEPESANVALLGTLAHKVFEGLFRPEERLPDPAGIPEAVEHLLDEAIRRIAPFLRASQWRVERRHLVAETVRAAQAWRDVLGRLNAGILASEAWLQGSWAGIPIHGQADLLLGLPGDRLLVVDYKRSKSGSRRVRMEKGYDSQGSLYREMLETGGPKDEADRVLQARIRAAVRTGVVYYMLNDRVSLTDALLPGADAVPGWQALGNDVASHAMSLIRRRLDEVGAGQVRLNREGDAEFFEKQAGIKPYALDNSPLIALFTVPGEAEEAQ